MTKLPPQPIEEIVWDEKYRYKKWRDGVATSDEQTVDATLLRAVRGIYRSDPDKKARLEAEEVVRAHEFCPAGRELSGAGTDKRVTLVNCYVNATIEDSMATEVGGGDSLGILEAHNVASYSLQMGGGIGTDFSTVRPRGAIVRRTHSVSSGVLPFMGMWDGMSRTIVSSGSRRGAMMATLRCDHPDLEEFITAKHEPGVLNQFNLSVLVTDEFMEAVEKDMSWDLGFTVPRADGQHVTIVESTSGERWYVYRRLQAREIWHWITDSTYRYAEPGVIFIDRINDLNNLRYCETISCTNPCGEQPLPPYGACVLGYVNLAMMVDDPFTSEAMINNDRLERAVRVGVRLLDNVITETQYPVPEMRREAESKRRIGLGVMGLANMLQMLGYRYGSEDAVKITEGVMERIRNDAYSASIELAALRAPFPRFDADKFLAGKFVAQLPDWIKANIRQYGIRNGVLLTIAPTGTTSLLFGNVSGGVEPTFAWTYTRKMVRESGETDTLLVEDYGYRLYKDYCVRERIGFDEDDLPNYMVTAQELDVGDHLAMQAACQRYVDAAISKTINCPEEMSFEEFQNVYDVAYQLGCKSCTTYRPCPETERVRGSVLSTKREAPTLPPPMERPDELLGRTYKVKWPHSPHAFYVTINDHESEGGGRVPFEIFINTKDTQHQEWVAALTRSLSAIFRRGGDISFVPIELQEVHSATGEGAWIDKKYVPSLVALVGNVIERHFAVLGLLSETDDKTEKGQGTIDVSTTFDDEVRRGSTCPACAAPGLVHQEGCDICVSCGYSNCG